MNTLCSSALVASVSRTESSSLRFSGFSLAGRLAISARMDRAAQEPEKDFSVFCAFVSRGPPSPGLFVSSMIWMEFSLFSAVDMAVCGRVCGGPTGYYVYKYESARTAVLGAAGRAWRIQPQRSPNHAPNPRFFV